MVTTLRGIDLSMDCMMRVFENLNDGTETMFREAFGYQRTSLKRLSAEVKAMCSGILQEYKVIYDEYLQHKSLSEGYQALQNAAENGYVNEHVIRFYELHPNEKFVLDHFRQKPATELEIIKFMNRPFQTLDCLKHFQAMTVVTLSGCKLTDDDIKALSLLGNMKFLNISANFDLTGKYISECRKVVALDIGVCLEVTSFRLSEIAEALRLEQLNIIGCETLVEEINSHNINEIFLNLNNLYKLCVDARIDQCIFPFIGGLMPKLKIMNFNSNKIDVRALLRALTKNRNIEALRIKGVRSTNSVNRLDWTLISKIPRLKKLYIHNGYLEPLRNVVLNPMPHLEEIYLESCDNISHTSLVTLYNACRNLNTFYVTGFNNLNMIFRIIKARRQQTVTSDIPLSLLIDAEYAYKIIINDRRYKTAVAAGLVKVELVEIVVPDWMLISVDEDEDEVE